MFRIFLCSLIKMNVPTNGRFASAGTVLALCLISGYFEKWESDGRIYAKNATFCRSSIQRIAFSKMAIWFGGNLLRIVGFY